MTWRVVRLAGPGPSPTRRMGSSPGWCRILQLGEAGRRRIDRRRRNTSRSSMILRRSRHPPDDAEDPGCDDPPPASARCAVLYRCSLHREAVPAAPSARTSSRATRRSRSSIRVQSNFLAAPVTVPATRIGVASTPAGIRLQATRVEAAALEPSASSGRFRQPRAPPSIAVIGVAVEAAASSILEWIDAIRPARPARGLARQAVRRLAKQSPGLRADPTPVHVPMLTTTPDRSSSPPASSSAHGRS